MAGEVQHGDGDMDFIIAEKQGDEESAKKLLEDSRATLGKDWQPKGSTSEGDVRQKQHVETTPLTRFWESWDGSAEPARSFEKLDGHLQATVRR